MTTVGTVTSGPFAGDQFRRVVTYADVNAVTECLKPDGLRELSNGVLTVTILPL